MWFLCAILWALVVLYRARLIFAQRWWDKMATERKHYKAEEMLGGFFFYLVAGWIFIYLLEWYIL